MQIAATAALERNIERGLRVVRELSVIVRNVYVKDSSKRAFWESVSHVEKASRRTQQDEDDDDGSQPPPSQG